MENILDQSITSDAWTIAQSDLSQTVVHHTETTLSVTHVAGLDGYAVRLVQPVTIAGYRIGVTSESELFDSKADALGFADMASDGIDDGSLRLEAIGILGHEGDTESTSFDSLTTRNEDTHPEFTEATTPFQDVVCVRPQTLPDGVEPADVVVDLRDILAFVYGQRDDIPDTLQSISNPETAYGSATIEIFTTTVDDLDDDPNQADADS